MARLKDDSTQLTKQLLVFQFIKIVQPTAK